MSLSKDELGDRMKGYEAAEDRRFPAGLPIYARIDGRSFSRFTRGMARPYDAGMSAAMVAAVSGLVEATHARIGYTQSDEISLVWLAEGDAQSFFDGRVQKLCSVLSGLATVHFNAALNALGMGFYAQRLPHFDCRVLSLPSRTEAANMFLWRELDARKNAVAMAAQSQFSAKQLHGKRQAAMLDMLDGAGVDFENYPAFFTRGTFVRRVLYERAFTAEELAAIPERHRPKPDAMVIRSEVRSLAMPRFSTVANREAVIFDAADPAESSPSDGASTRQDQ